MNPRVSVAITTFNQDRFIGQTIESVLAQTYLDREIIVVDDGSTDGTQEVVRRFGGAVRYVHQRNRGVAGARNRAVAESSGDLIAFLDGDDLWEPEKLHLQVELYDGNPDVGLVACDVMHFSEKKVLWERSLSWTIFSSEDTSSLVGNFYESFVRANPISTTSQVLIPAAVLRRVGPSREDLEVASDYDLYLRIAQLYPVAFLNRVLTRWRFLESSVSGRSDLRLFRWKKDSLAALRLQLRQHDPGIHELLTERVSELEAQVTWEAWRVGCRGDSSDRRLARAALWSIAAGGNRRAIAYLLTLCLPPFGRRALVTFAQRLRGNQSSQTDAARGQR